MSFIPTKEDGKVATIRVQLTDEQLKQLDPLFDYVDEHPRTGFIIAQVWQQSGHGFMTVGFTTPQDVKKGMEKTIAKYSLVDEAG